MEAEMTLKDAQERVTWIGEHLQRLYRLIGTLGSMQHDTKETRDEFREIAMSIMSAEQAESVLAFLKSLSPSEGHVNLAYDFWHQLKIMDNALAMYIGKESLFVQQMSSLWKFAEDDPSLLVGGESEDLDCDALEERSLSNDIVIVFRNQKVAESLSEVAALCSRLYPERPAGGYRGMGKLVGKEGCFDGEIVDGVCEGPGRFTFSTGDYFEGTWAGGKRTGAGVYVFGDEATTFEGTFEDDDPTFGCLTYKNGDAYRGTVCVADVAVGPGKNYGICRAGLGELLSVDGSRYVGWWCGDTKTGFAVVSTRKNIKYSLWQQNELVEDICGIGVDGTCSFGDCSVSGTPGAVRTPTGDVWSGTWQSGALTAASHRPGEAATLSVASLRSLLSEKDPMDTFVHTQLSAFGSKWDNLIAASKRRWKELVGNDGPPEECPYCHELVRGYTVHKRNCKKRANHFAERKKPEYLQTETRDRIAAETYKRDCLRKLMMTYTGESYDNVALAVQNVEATISDLEKQMAAIQKQMDAPAGAAAEDDNHDDDAEDHDAPEDARRLRRQSLSGSAGKAAAATTKLLHEAEGCVLGCCVVDFVSIFTALHSREALGGRTDLRGALAVEDFLSFRSSVHMILKETLPRQLTTKRKAWRAARTVMDERLFRDMYAVLFDAIKTETLRADARMDVQLCSLSDVTLEELGAKSKYMPKAGADENPYMRAVMSLRKLSNENTPFEKLLCLLETADQIVGAMDDVLGGKPTVVMAEDKIPLFHYVVIKARVPSILAEINFISSLALEDELELCNGQTRYRLAELSAAVEYVGALSWDITDRNGILVPITALRSSLHNAVQSIISQSPHVAASVVTGVRDVLQALGSRRRADDYTPHIVSTEPTPEYKLHWDGLLECCGLHLASAQVTMLHKYPRQLYRELAAELSLCLL